MWVFYVGVLMNGLVCVASGHDARRGAQPFRFQSTLSLVLALSGLWVTVVGGTLLPLLLSDSAAATVAEFVYGPVLFWSVLLSSVLSVGWLFVRAAMHQFELDFWARDDYAPDMTLYWTSCAILAGVAALWCRMIYQVAFGA